MVPYCRGRSEPTLLLHWSMLRGSYHRADADDGVTDHLYSSSLGSYIYFLLSGLSWALNSRSKMSLACSSSMPRQKCHRQPGCRPSRSGLGRRCRLGTRLGPCLDHGVLFGYVWLIFSA